MRHQTKSNPRLEEIELFHNHDHINAIKLEKAAWETADTGRAERATKLRLEYLDQRTCRLPPEGPSVPPPAAVVPVSLDPPPVVVPSELATLPSSEEFDPLPELDVETAEALEGAGEPGAESEPDQPEPGAELEPEPPEQPEHSSDRARQPEPEPKPEPLFVAPQLPPPFVLHEVDTALLQRDEPARLRVCDQQFKDEQNERHERHIDAFSRRWSAVGHFMSAEHGAREEAKLEQMTSLHGSLKPSVTYRAFAEVMRDNYRIQVMESTTVQQQGDATAEKSAKKKKK